MTPLPAPPVTSRTVVNSSYPVFGNNAVLTPQQVPQFSTYGRAQPSIIDLPPQDHAPIPTLGYPSSADMKHPSFPESVVGNVFNSVRSVDLSLNLSQPPTLVYSNTTTSLSLNETAPPQAAPTFSEPRSNFNYPPRAPFSAPSTYSDPSISPPTHYLGESSYTSSSGYVISPPQTTSTYHQNFDYSPPQHSSHAPSSYYTDTSSSTYQQNFPPAAASIYDHHSIIVNDEYSLMKGNSPSNSRSPSHSNSTTDRFPTNNNTMFAMDATFYETIPAGRSNSFTTGSNNNSITGENEEDLVHHLTSL
eukprot:gene14252-15760_t